MRFSSSSFFSCEVFECAISFRSCFQLAIFSQFSSLADIIHSFFPFRMRIIVRSLTHTDLHISIHSGLGWGNAVQELLLNALLAWKSGRTYVFLFSFSLPRHTH